MSVYIRGYGITKFRKSKDSIYSLALEAATALIRRFEIERKDIDGIIIASSSPEPYLANVISDMLGIRPKIACKVEQMCSSGSRAITTAYSYIRAELAKNILVIGVDKHDSISNILEWDPGRGNFKHPTHWAALYTQLHMRLFGTTEEDLALVTVKNRKNGIKNGYSYFNNELTLEEVMNSKQIVGPLRLYHCSYICDGAAALLLTDKPDDKPVRIVGIGEKSIGASISSITDYTCLESTVIASKEAYKMANISVKDIDLFEIHDAFSICEIMAYESLNLVEKGKGRQLLRDLIDDKASIKINSSGGLLGNGHPLATTGVAQAVELTMQLKEEAGERQVKGCRIAALHNMAAAATTSNVLIFKREYG